HDYESFYRSEIENRRELNYPPFRQHINLIVTAEQERDASERAEAIADALRRAAEGRPVDVLGPAPAPLAKLRDRHRWHLMVKGEQGEAREIVRRVVADLGDQGQGTLSVDVDPVSLM
ncbi:MAG: primosomal protein N', partial [Armatimonadetes bacterium]|nr:primosomal protein N' [Armatimonadota bacterium]